MRYIYVAPNPCTYGDTASKVTEDGAAPGVVGQIKALQVEYLSWFNRDAVAAYCTVDRNDERVLRYKKRLAEIMEAAELGGADE